MNDSLENKLGIISNKAFQRLAEKTQVLFPRNGRHETVQNRLTHSYKVSAAAEIIKTVITGSNLDVDPRNVLSNVCLLHDIGHPPFGHEGATVLDKKIREKGLDEGFSDNNNNFVVIEKNQIDVSDYTTASLIKYPKGLYKSQRGLNRILENAIQDDIARLEKHIKIYKSPERTVICEIMDEADRNSYVCSDLADCFSLGLGNSDAITEILDSKKYFSKYIEGFLVTLSYAIKDKNKTLIKQSLNDLELRLSKNYYLGDNLKLFHVNEELVNLREDLYGIEKDLFIYNEEILAQRHEHTKMLENYIDWIFEGNFPSRTYARRYEISKTEEDRLRAIRDMIGETTDWFVLNHYRSQKKTSKTTSDTFSEPEQTKISETAL